MLGRVDGLPGFHDMRSIPEHGSPRARPVPLRRAAVLRERTNFP